MRNVSRKVLKYYASTGQAQDISKADSPFLRELASHSTVLEYSAGKTGLNGILVEDDFSGERYVVLKRNYAMHILLRR